MGFRASFEGGRLQYATVKGGGHMVPSTHPEVALQLLADFLYAGGGDSGSDDGIHDGA